MNIVDYIIVAVILLILGFSGWFIWKSKKSGKKCIGCPDSCACAKGNCSGSCNGCSNK